MPACHQTWQTTEGEHVYTICVKIHLANQGNEPDRNTAARMVLNDWLRGRLPYFVCPPFDDDKKPVTVRCSRAPSTSLDLHLHAQADPAAPRVAQMFSNIKVKSGFSPEDMNEPEE